MAKDLIRISVPTQLVRFCPGQSLATFSVEVVNESEQFATFQLEVTAPGADPALGASWYKLLPDVSTKQPPGDYTKFEVTLVEVPIPGFVGTMTLTVRVFSLELGEEKRDVLRLVVEQGDRLIPPTVKLPIPSFQRFPEELVEIPVSVSQPIKTVTEVSVRLLGLESEWFVSGTEQRLKLDANGNAETDFICQLPVATQTLSKTYLFTVEATQRDGAVGQISGELEIAPQGFIDFSCPTRQLQLPAQKRWFPGWWADFVTYPLQFENASNLHQQVSVQVQSKDQQRCTFQILPDRASLAPGQSVPLQLGVRSQRPWWGTGRWLTFEVKALVSDRRLDVRNDTQILKLRIFPVMRLWMQLLAALVLLLLFWWASWLNPNNLFWGHQGPVTSVQFNGISNRVMSGSDDNTIRHWAVKGFFNPLVNQSLGEVGKSGKAVRVVRYKPVENDWIATGLENGEIRLWNLLDKYQRPQRFSYEKDDRVLDLTFSKGASYLFSGHGSGWVLQWDFTPDRALGVFSDSPETPVNQQQVDFAVYALALAGNRGQSLVIGGRYNQLVVWHWLKDEIVPIPYPHPGGQDDYLTSLDTALYKSNLLATADTRGYITLWDLQQCFKSASGSCQPLDEWRQDRPVRSVALSDDGCYLTSGGDDGQVILWPLTADGKRDLAFFEGKVMAKSNRKQRFNSVDVKVVQHQVFVTSGSDDRQVRVNRFKPNFMMKCDRETNL